MDQLFFGSKIFFYQQFLDNFFLTNLYFEKWKFCTIIFWTKIIFQTKNYFLTKQFFSDQNLLGPKNILDQKFFWTKISFWTKIFFGPKIFFGFFKKKFQTKKILFGKKILSKTCLVQKNLWSKKIISGLNTSLVAKGALAHRLQCRTACKTQNGHQGGPKWPVGSGKGFSPRL